MDRRLRNMLINSFCDIHAESYVLPHLGLPTRAVSVLGMTMAPLLVGLFLVFWAREYPARVVCGNYRC